VKTIGLTGGIGSGKSTAARILADLGAHVIDADLVGHAVYRPGAPGFQPLFEAFGEAIVAADGTIDRKRLASVVFADSGKLAELNRIVHPLIAAAIREQLAALEGSGRRAPVVVEAAVLIEASWATLVEEVWVVTADRAAVLARVAAQRGLLSEQIEARIRAQLSDEERQRRAHVVIDNSGTIEQLRDRLTRLWNARLAGVTEG
jgi:dephospho-CoA kinase